jgi:hypothetical protein
MNNQPRDSNGRFLSSKPKEHPTAAVERSPQPRDDKGRFLPRPVPQKQPSANYGQSPHLRGEGNRYAIVCEVKYKQNGVMVKKYITVVQGDIKLSKGIRKAVREQAAMDYAARNAKVKPIQTIDRFYGVRVDPNTGKPYNWEG